MPVYIEIFIKSTVYYLPAPICAHSGTQAG
jgi:hypothetical protein